MKFILRRYLYQYRKYSTFKMVGFKIFLQGYGQFQNENEMLISIQSWCVIYQITAKEHCYLMQFSP